MESASQWTWSSNVSSWLVTQTTVAQSQSPNPNQSVENSKASTKRKPHSRTHTIYFLCCVTDGPDNVTIIGPKSVHAGDFTMLYCSTASVPPAKFTWLFKGEPTDGHETVYLIQSSQNSDSGTYTCTAANTVTGRSQTVHHELTVSGLWQKRKERNWHNNCKTKKTFVLLNMF